MFNLKMGFDAKRHPYSKGILEESGGFKAYSEGIWRRPSLVENQQKTDGKCVCNMHTCIYICNGQTMTSMQVIATPIITL